MGMTRDYLLEQEDYFNSQMTEEELEKKANWIEQEEMAIEVAQFLGYQKVMNIVCPI